MARRSPPTEKELETLTLELLRERGTSTACPSEIARAAGGKGWRGMMPRVREVAARLQAQPLLDAYQRGRGVAIASARGPIRLRLREAASVDYRKHPDRYRSGRGEEGVLTVEPYKSELLPLWKFATPAAARRSAAALWKKFVAYREEGDFVGMDMARKYLQMGWTRARRYANHPGGRKYDSKRRQLPRVEDTVKAESARIFREHYERALADPTYLELRAAHRASSRSKTRDVQGSHRSGPPRGRG